MRSPCLLLLVLALPASETDPTPEPAVVLRQSVAALAANDLGALLAHAGGFDLVALGTAWDAIRALPAQPAIDAQFDHQLGLLTRDDAVDTIMAMVEPHLAGLDAEAVANQIGFAQVLLNAAAGMDPRLAGAPEKPFLESLIPDLQAWFLAASVIDPATTRKALEILVARARELGLDSAEDLRRRSLPELLELGGRLLAGLKEALAVYDLDLDAFLASLEVLGSEGSGDFRRISLKATLFGSEREFATDLERIEGRWQPALIRAVTETWQRIQGSGGGTGGATPGAE